MKKLLLVGMAFFALTHMGLSATFYIDPINGSDQGDGSQNAPWQTIQKTLDASLPTGRAKVAAAEDITVVLKGGQYGSLEMTQATGVPKAAASGAWTVYKAAPGETPVFTSITISYDIPTDVNIRFDGIHILPPAEPAGRAKAAVVPNSGFGINGVSNVVYENGKCWGSTRQTHDGMIIVQNCSNITIRKNEIGNCGYGIKFLSSTGCKVLFNHIHSLSSSGIKYMTNNKNFLIEGNHIHDQRTWDGSHASAVSIRSGDVTIRGNIMHDGFTSSGMMLYNNDGGTTYYFSNITFENNLLYDITNTYCLRLYNMVSNIVVRNNTFVGKLSGKNDARYYLSTAITGGSSALSVYNNVLVGICSIGGTITNNIMWSCQSGEWKCTLGNNVIKTCNSTYKPLDYFENGFFVQKPNFTSMHAQTMDYRLAAGSPAINFGDPSKQPATSLGTLGADGFILPDGPARDASHHSCGAYEVGAGQGVIEPVFTALEITPASACVLPGKTVAFTATALDQYRAALTPQPAVTWTIDQGQEISSDGVFTAGASEGGPYTVTAIATVDAVTETTTATVTVAQNWQDDFNAGKKQTWFTGGGTWSVVSDELKNTGTGRMETWAGDGSWTDITVTAEMAPSQGDVWLLFRVQDRDNYYLFTLSGPSGYGELYKLVNGAYTKIQGSTTSFGTGISHLVKAALTGNTIKIYKGTSLVLEATDTQFKDGYVGFGGNNATGSFDNITVTFGSGVTKVNRAYRQPGSLTVHNGSLPPGSMYTLDGHRISPAGITGTGVFLKVDTDGNLVKLITICK